MDTAMETSGADEKLTITLGMVQRIIRLSKLQLRNLFLARKKQVPEAHGELEPADVSVLVFAEMLEKLAFLRPEQRTLLIGELLSIFEAVPTAGRVYTLFFSDGKYALWEGRAGFLDIENGDTVEELANPAQETMMYNLNEIYRRFIVKLEKRSGLHAKKQNDDRDVEESADLRDRTDYGLS